MFISPCRDVSTNWALSRAQANLTSERAVRVRGDAETAFLFPLHLLPNDIAYCASWLHSLPDWYCEQTLNVHFSGDPPSAESVLILDGGWSLDCGSLLRLASAVSVCVWALIQMQNKCASVGLNAFPLFVLCHCAWTGWIESGHEG